MLGFVHDQFSPLYLVMAESAAEDCDRHHGWHAVVAVTMSAMALEAFLNETKERARTLVHEDSEQKLLELVHNGRAPADLSEERRHQLLEWNGLARPLEPPVTRQIAVELHTAPKKKRSVQERAGLLYQLATGQKADFESGQLSELRLLVRLRNKLVHLEIPHAPIELDCREEDVAEYARHGGIWLGRIVARHYHPPEVEQLSKLVELNSGTDETAWIDRISTRAVAKWAIATVVRYQRTILAALPDSKLAESLDVFRKFESY